MINQIQINGRCVGPGFPVYIVAEMSSNHRQNFEQAVKIVEAAKASGADAIKLQTYRPNTLTINCNNDYFKIGKGSLWQDRNLYELYQEACTPWDWQPKLKVISDEIGIDLFSTAFDYSAVDFLEKMGVPVHKVASFEIVDIPLIEKMARTGKPLIISTGMATLDEIQEAGEAAKNAGAKQIALLKCTSNYPAPLEEMNLMTIPHLAETFHVPIGLSDHTLGTAVPTAAVALGACIIEKHLTLSRSIPGPDSAFSLEPHEFKIMAEAIRTVEKALGEVHYGAGDQEAKNRIFRRSLFIVKDMKAREVFAEDNVRSIRPGYGLHPRHLADIYGKKAKMDIKKGTPLRWDLVDL